MRYLGLFFISSLFTLNVFGNDICQPLAITDLTVDQVSELIDQEFDFTQVCEDGYDILSLIKIYGDEDVRQLVLANTFTVDDLCSPTQIAELTVGQVSELIDQGFDFTQGCEDEYDISSLLYEDEYDISSLLYIYGNEDILPFLLANRRLLRWPSLVQIVKSDATSAEKMNRISKIIPLQLLGRFIRPFDLDLINSRDRSGLTPLMWSARMGDYELTRLLIDEGFVRSKQINAKDSNGNTAIVWAAKNGHRSLVRLLMSSGKADFDPQYISQLLDLYDTVNQS